MISQRPDGTESALRELPEPVLPRSLTESVLLAAADADRTRAAGAARPERTPKGLPWRTAGALLGVAIGLGVHVSRLLLGKATLDLLTPRVAGWLDGSWLPTEVDPLAVLLAAGLVLYLLGLFGGGTQRPDPRR